jgi:NADPH:quinone reductase-like Zn-dependent oxidoreductase
VTAGEVVLVTGAAGGVGTVAVQLAVDRGARVIATAIGGPAASDRTARGSHVATDTPCERIGRCTSNVHSTAQGAYKP